jgi:hypothetical protein
MRRVLTAAIAFAAALALAACVEEEHGVVEGEWLEVGELEYNVVLTRFLNPALRDDGVYLADQPDLPPDERYLGVFIQAENDSDELRTPARNMYIEDARDNRFDPLGSESPFALTLEPLEPGESLPRPSSVAATGPVQGGMLLFQIPLEAIENQPLLLKVPEGPRDEDPRYIELDI